MIITEKRRFIYSLIAFTYVIIFVLVLLNVYAIEELLVFIIIGFLVLVEFTQPSAITLSWRKNITIFVVICVILFAIIFYQATATI